MAIFVMIFIGFSAFIVWFNYNQNSKAALQAADRLMADISEKVRERVEAHLQPLFTMADLAPELREIVRKPNELNHPGSRFLMRALDRHPQILSFYMGFEDGEFFQVQALAQEDGRISAQLNAPNNSQFALRRIEQATDEVRLTFWRFLNANRQTVGARTDSSTSYDPRVRPWYEAAQKTTEVVTTNLYVFASSGEIGLTVARRFDGAVAGVFGADVTLDSLSDFVDSQRLGESSILLIFDNEGQLVAHPDKSQLSRVVDGEIEAVQVSNLNDPVISELMEAFAATDGSEDIQTVIEAGSERYVARITRMPLADGADWYLAFVVPVQEFIAPIIKTGTWGFLISLLAAALVIPILVFAARLISRPLNELVHEADAIRDFRLDDPVTVQSRVKEVQRLTQAIATTKSALQTFGRYVPKALVKQLVQSGEGAEVGGQRRVVTLMFSDIADFTTIVEDMPPEALMQQMSTYFQELGGSVLKRGGTIDKYIGDAIMAFWNAPLPDSDHAYNACLAALECQKLSQSLNEGWRGSDRPELRTRFGLHLGEVVVGNVGSSDRMDYTAIGASVNLAARLEGLNKYYGTQILVSEAVVESIRGKFLVRPVDLVLAKGATHPVEIFELVGTLEAATESGQESKANTLQKELCAKWEKAYKAYRSQDWRAAANAFSALQSEGVADQLLGLYVARTNNYLNSPPPSDWNGVEIFEVK